MKTVLGVHIRGNPNLGDNYCHPLDYFNIGCDLDLKVNKVDIKNLPAEEPDYVILGGGALARRAPNIRKHFPSSVLIGWGLGYTTRKNILPIDRGVHYRLRSGYALYGCRDYINNSGIDYVPCASCMHPYFDSIPEPSCDTVVYGHGKLGDLSVGAAEISAPYADNMSGLSFSEALDHIASGETVITSSYHGAYWATLLGRKVSMVPFGSKFMSMKFPPAVTDGVLAGVRKARKFDEALEDSRHSNGVFRNRVYDLIWSG